MIKSDAEVLQSIELMGGMYRALVSLHRDIAPQNFTNYQVLAEGPIDEIARLQRDIDAYLGITETAATTSQAG
ncbi:MAG TPA: hypothetical protein VMP01_11030 [Pirellulaceae bacterium]|nr:hypothetical protein [Pirellulaceae bacterium]